MAGHTGVHLLHPRRDTGDILRLAVLGNFLLRESPVGRPSVVGHDGTADLLLDGRGRQERKIAVAQ